MPDFDPIAAINRIRARYPAMKILVVSAYDDDIYVQGLLRAGVDGYHLKDQPLSDLRLALQRVLDGEKWITSRLVDKLLRYTDAHSPAPLLTARQREILSLLQQGLDNQNIAQQLGLSVKTIENHLTRLYRQLDVQSRLEAVNYVRQNPQVLALSGKQAVADPAVAESATQKPVTILLVDDNPRYRRQLRRMIGRVSPQATIYEAGNIQEALHLTQRVLPRLALVDVVLSDTEDGIRCTRRIKALSPASRIILISAYPDREFHRRGLEAGAVAFLDKKNLDKATLQQIINDVLA
jgi:DNA-binding NarL/FixJ family response regulator